MPRTRHVLLHLILVPALALSACGDPDEGSATADTVSHADTSPPGPLFPDAVVDATTDGTDPSGDGTDAVSPCAEVTCDGAGHCVVDGAGPTCVCDEGFEVRDAIHCDPVDPCAGDPCGGVAEFICVPDAEAEAGYRCACDEGFALHDDACLPSTCEDEDVITALTVYDMTPLPGVTNPVRDGFDPLVRGDTVRVVVEVHRLAGARDLRLFVFASGLEIDPESVRFDGAPTELVTDIGARRIELDLPPGFVSGRVAFDAVVPPTGPPLAAVDARALTEVGCPIVGSASGARIHLAGSTDPKHSGCSSMSDLRSVQISDAIPDKNTSVYEERNGTFTEISSAYKILTQMTLCLRRDDERTVSLSGSADGTRPWTIDNFLLIETYDADPDLPTAARTGLWITTSVNISAPSALADGTPIHVLNHASLPGDYTGSRTPSNFTFPARVVQLDPLLPVGESVWFRFTGLDTGVAGHLSRLFITSAEPGEHVAECRTSRDCPLATSYNGSSTQIRAGCLEGRCTPVACASDATCGAGRRCLQGFCTEGCAADGDCPAGEVCGQGLCTRLDQGGCRSFADCPLGEVCFFGRCEAGCFHPVAQNPTYANNFAPWSLCISSPEACPRCEDPETRCWYNYCRDCEIDAHCGAGQVCADYRCVAP